MVDNLPEYVDYPWEVEEEFRTYDYSEVYPISDFVRHGDKLVAPSEPLKLSNKHIRTFKRRLKRREQDLNELMRRVTLQLPVLHAILEGSVFQDHAKSITQFFLLFLKDVVDREKQFPTKKQLRQLYASTLYYLSNWPNHLSLPEVTEMEVCSHYQLDSKTLREYCNILADYNEKTHVAWNLS
jgi:hypothetical protein